jgi:glycosyltransferase involved in cell wall biosynthesis
MARAARDDGFEVHVLTHLGEGREAIQREAFATHHLSWRRSSLSPFDNVRAIAEIRRHLHRIRPDIVHAVAMKPALLGGLATSGLRRTAVVTSITGIGSAFLATSLAGRALQAGMGHTLARLLNRSNAHAIVQNPDDKALLERLGVRAEAISLIAGSGVDTEAIQPSPEPAGPIRIAFVGRMLEDKGVRTLVAAFEMLQQKGIEAGLVLAGEPDPENPTSISSDELAAWGRRPGITVAGHMSDIAGLWARSHIAVLPSRREGLPKSLLEAAAAGRPMVAADVPGCREVVVHGVTGLLARVDDPADFAAALSRLVGDRALRQRLGAAARAIAEERFSADAIGRQTVELYRAMLQRIP